MHPSMVVRICKQCGKKFIVDRKRLKQSGCKYCTWQCYHNSRKSLPKVSLICKYCGKKFTVCPSRLKYGKRSFCSLTCYYANLNSCDYDASLIKRFKKCIGKPLPNGCWPWLGSVTGSGYGSIFHRGKESNNGSYVSAHRLAYILANGPIPEGLLICHHCDNCWCVAPNHLFVGTHQDNMNDMSRKGRGRKASWEYGESKNEEEI